MLCHVLQPPCRYNRTIPIDEPERYDLEIKPPTRGVGRVWVVAFKPVTEPHICQDPCGFLCADVDTSWAVQEGQSLDQSQGSAAYSLASLHSTTPYFSMKEGACMPLACLDC
jgi:hypothetical protein